MITESVSQDSSSPTAATNAAEVMCVLDAKGVIRFATPATAAFYGYELADVIGRSSLHFIATESQEVATARWRALVEDPNLASDEMFVTMLCAQGRRIPIRVSVWRLPGRDEFLLIHHVVEHLQDRLEILYAIMAAVSGTLELDPLMDSVLREVSRLIPCNVSTLYILEQDGSIQARRWIEGRLEGYRSVAQEGRPELETRRIMRETGRPVIVTDCDTDPRWVKLPNFRPIRSWLGAPLIHQGEFLGEIDLDSAEPNAFTEEDAELVQALASQVAAALHNVRQFESEQRRAERHQAISDVSQAISRLELRSVLDVVYQKVSSLMDTSTFFIGLYDAEAEQVWIVGSYERGKPVPDEVRGVDLGLTGLVIRTRQSIIIHDSQREPVPDAVIVEGEMPRSVLMFPLITQDEIVGVISVQSYQPDAYSPDDIEMLETIAGAIATTVSNAQLYDRALERLTALETLHHLGLDLAAVQNPAAIAQLVTRTALQLFGPGEVRLYLCDATSWTPSTWVGHATGDPDHPRVGSRDGIEAGSLARQASETRHPVILHDLSRQPGLQTEFGTPWLVQAVAISPIIRSGHMFATLSLLYGEPYFFRSDRLRALELLCMQAATALENARYMITLRRRLDEVAALQDLAREVSSSYALSDVFDVVVHTLQDVYQCRGAWIALCDDQGEEIALKAAVGVEKEYFERARFKIGEYAAGRVVETGEPIYVADSHSDPEFRIIDPGVRSMMIVPLTVHGSAIGALGIDGAVPNAFTHEHERVLTIAGGQIAAVIEMINLLHQTRDRANQLAVANASLEAQDALRHELVYQVSHDLRSPLQIVYGYADLLYQGELGPVTDMQTGVLELMLKRTRAIERMTIDILASKSISQDMLELQTVNLNDICQQAVADSRMLHEEQGFTFAAELAPGALTVEVDYNRLSRVFDNLIGNAVKFSPDGGTITVRTERDPEAGPAAGHALVSIADQGIGIAPDQIPYVFERFFRADRKRFSGSGLGLYIVQQIVEAHGGRVWVTSEPGVGSTFTFTLPLVNETK